MSNEQLKPCPFCGEQDAKVYQQGGSARWGAISMTEDQKTLARALARANLFPGSNTKRFAWDMEYRASLPNPKPLTGAQAEYLRTAVIRHRRSIPAEVVALAERMGTTAHDHPLDHKEHAA